MHNMLRKAFDTAERKLRTPAVLFIVFGIADSVPSLQNREEQVYKAVEGLMLYRYWSSLGIDGIGICTNRYQPI